MKKLTVLVVVLVGFAAGHAIPFDDDDDSGFPFGGKFTNNFGAFGLPFDFPKIEFPKFKPIRIPKIPPIVIPDIQNAKPLPGENMQGFSVASYSSSSNINGKEHHEGGGSMMISKDGDVKTYTYKIPN